MRLTILAVVWVASVTGSFAQTLTCSEYFDRIQTLDTSDLIPNIGLQANENAPSTFTMTGIRNIDAGIECRDNVFGGLDFTLASSGEADRMRWAIFSSIAVAATRSGGTVDEGTELVTSLLDQALMNARKEEIRTGINGGYADADYYGTTITVAVGMGGLSVQIDP